MLLDPSKLAAHFIKNTEFLKTTHLIIDGLKVSTTGGFDKI